MIFKASDDGFTVVSRRKNNSVNSNVHEAPSVQRSCVTNIKPTIAKVSSMDAIITQHNTPEWSL
uniref:Uncharacterized protein n=1 Tax=Timema cristinae TaxID=61476 RepID=A0A7R9GS28_TIMCR|nr:unnamed protein product [Timema cristinae]